MQKLNGEKSILNLKAVISSQVKLRVLHVFHISSSYWYLALFPTPSCGHANRWTGYVKMPCNFQGFQCIFYLCSIRDAN